MDQQYKNEPTESGEHKWHKKMKLEEHFLDLKFFEKLKKSVEQLKDQLKLLSFDRQKEIVHKWFDLKIDLLF